MLCCRKKYINVSYYYNFYAILILGICPYPQVVKQKNWPSLFVIRQGVLYYAEMKNAQSCEGTVLQFLQILGFHCLKFAQISILNIPQDRKCYILFLSCGFIISCLLTENAIKIFIELYNETIIFIKLYTSGICF